MYFLASFVRTVRFQLSQSYICIDTKQGKETTPVQYILDYMYFPFQCSSKDRRLETLTSLESTVIVPKPNYAHINQ